MSSAEPEPEDEDAPDRHRTTVGDLRLDELVRVTTKSEDGAVDRAAVIAKWPYAQRDFTPEDHPEIPTRTKRWIDHTGDEDTEHTEEKPQRTGERVTLITETGQTWAVVDWNHSDDPPYLYLLLMDGEEPESRKWKRTGEVDSVARYGPQPSYKLSSFGWVKCRQHYVTALKRAADGGLETDYPYGLGGHAAELRNLANVIPGEAPPLSDYQLELIEASCQALRDHVINTGEPVLSDDVTEDAKILDTRFSRSFHTAMFPDGDGGWITNKRNPSGKPGDDIPPWEQEQDADPDFTPLGTRGDDGDE